MLDEKLSEAITMSYDKVNSRISVTILFPEPVCLKASITFKGRKIPNGDFDVIVLSSYVFIYFKPPNQIQITFFHHFVISGSDTTLVHKNIARRNICYEAKLLNVFAQPKAKARKVLCYIGPKQVD